MIAKLTGLLDTTALDHAVIDVAGVGYLVFASRKTLDRLGTPGDAVSVVCETHVREDHIHLYGFADATERAWFRLLTTVQGVGPKAALAVLSVLDTDALATAIAADDRRAIARADGVGPKTAARIAAELKDKAGGIALGPTAAGAVGMVPTKAPAPQDGHPPLTADAVSALVNLGYGQSEAFTAVSRVLASLGEAPSLGQVIPAALKELAA